MDDKASYWPSQRGVKDDVVEETEKLEERRRMREAKKKEIEQQNSSLSIGAAWKLKKLGSKSKSKILYLAEDEAGNWQEQSSEKWESSANEKNAPPAFASAESEVESPLKKLRKSKLAADASKAVKSRSPISKGDSPLKALRKSKNVDWDGEDKAKPSSVGLKHAATMGMKGNK